jgi:suppressor for copper-sensitivity B
MTMVTTLFACNLWGLFDIPLPERLANAGAVPTRLHGLGGHFLTGALATLLATPCSAPFLGTAIGFAFAGGPGEILAVFVALAVGLALPYLVVAAYPGLATRLPKPGRWMVWLRRGLGVALIGTAVWLLSVLAVNVGVAAAFSVGGLALATILILAVRRVMPDRLRRLAAWTVVPLTLAALLVPLGNEADGPVPAVAGWRPLEPSAIAALVGEGRVVFVNVTADWCLTCKVNERLVLAREPVRGALAADDVIAMQGDWTRPSDMIARYLAGFGRYGIPFDAVYGPALPDGQALPELLTPDLVIAAIARARGAALPATAGSGPVADRR